MNFLEFANPSGWWWLALAIPILLLYILKIRLRRQQVPTLLFWDQLFDEKKPRAWWQRLRHLLSLLLQFAFLVLVVAALVDPLWSWQREQARRIVLVVDNSASMRTLEEEGSTRLNEAKQAAKSLVQALRSKDQMAVLSATGRPEVVIGMTDHQRSLTTAIDGIPATDGPTDVAAAVTAAERLLADHEHGEILVLTDGCFADLDALKANPRLTLYGVGSKQDNVAITRYQVRRSLLDAVGYQVLLDVTNFSDSEKQCRVELTLGEELVDVLPLALKPGETVSRFVDHTSSTGGELHAKLDITDALETDNRALAVLPERKPVRVQLVTKGNLFLKGVLESIPLVDLQITSEAPSVAPPGGILVLDKIVPAQLPSGRVVVVDPQTTTDAWTLGEPLSQPIVAKVDKASPLVQHVRLDNVLFPGARQMTFSVEVEPLIQDPLDGPLFARLKRPGGDAVVLACNLDQGDLPLRIAFPVLMKNTIEWFQGNTGELRPALTTGAMLAVDVSTVRESQPAAAREQRESDAQAVEVQAIDETPILAAQPLELVSPSQQVTPLTRTGEQVTLGPLLETGLWSVRPASAPGDKPLLAPVANMSASTANESGRDILVACNLVDPAESDLRPRGELAEVQGRRLAILGGQSLWFYLTLLAAVLIAAEWWLYQRRIVG
jgi:hypothetical protein